MNISKQFIFKIIAVILMIIAADFLLGNVAGMLFKRAKSGLCYQENYIMTKTNQDLLVLGSSRASYHYDSKILSDSLNMSVYNCGREGMWLYYHYGVFLSALERYKPKVIVLEVDLKDVYKGKESFSYGALSEHAPFYNKISAGFDSLLVAHDKRELVKLQSRLYRYNTKSFKLITGNLKKDPVDNNGYFFKKGNWTKELRHYEREPAGIDPDKINILQSFIDKSKANGITLIFSVSPLYQKVPAKVIAPLKALADKNSIKMISYLDNNKFLNDKSLFYDELHLNKEGAEIFTSDIAHELKQYIK